MKIRMKQLTFAILGSMFLVPNLFAQDSTYVLMGEFQKDWDKVWVERTFSGKQTKYEVIAEDDSSNLVLEASSAKSASGLWHMLNIKTGSRGKITWRWKVEKALSGNISEKTKKGDDYAARVFVVFEPHFISWKTRAICYVWAAKQPVGSKYRNPYAGSVQTIVVQSGGENDGKWITEERNFVKDYKKAFGKEPEMVTAVAIMVDTDNTGQEAFTRFDDIALIISNPEKEKAKNKKPKIMF